MKHDATTHDASERAALYALGALGAEEARAFEEHLAEGCEACAAEARQFERAVAELAWTCEPSEPPAALRDRLLARITAETGHAETAHIASRHRGGERTAPESPLLTVRAGEGEWVETSDRGVFVKLLFADSQSATVTTLVRMTPGSSVPAHRHKAVEQCLVLEGDLRTEDEVLGAGDFHCAPADSVHQRLTTQGGALLLIVAAESYEVLAPSRTV